MYEVILWLDIAECRGTVQIETKEEAHVKIFENLVT